MPVKEATPHQTAKKSSPAAPALANIRIVVADDHPVVRFGVTKMLQNEPGFEVVGEAEDGDDAITQTLELEPDILLLDLAMPRLPGLEAMGGGMNSSETHEVNSLDELDAACDRLERILSSRS